MSRRDRLAQNESVRQFFRIAHMPIEWAYTNSEAVRSLYDGFARVCGVHL